MLKGKCNLYLLYFIILLVLIRLAVLVTSPKPVYEDMVEEKYNGSMARDLLSGRFGIPLYEYHSNENTPGGKMIVNLLVLIPFFFLGPSLLALKIIPIFFALGSFIVWYKFLAKNFNNKFTFIFSLLFIFPPPYITKISLLCWGNHFESSLFTALTALFFFNIIDKSANGSKICWDKNPISFFLLGLSIGAGIYFALTYTITLIPVVISFFLLEKKIEQRQNFFVALSSFLSGIIPCLVYKFYQYLAFPTNNPIFYIQPYPELITKDLKMIIWKLVYLLSSEGLPKAFDFPKLFFLNLNIFSTIYYLIFIISFLIIFINQKENFKLLLKKICFFLKTEKRFYLDLEFFLMIYFFAYILILLCTNFFPPKTLEAGVLRLYRFISPLFLTILIIIILGIYQLLESRLKLIHYTGKIFFIILLIIGLYSNLELINFNNFGLLSIYRGYDYNFSLEMIRNKPFPEVNRRLKIMADADLRRAYDILGNEIKTMAGNDILKGVSLIKSFNSTYSFNISKYYIRNLNYNNVEMMENTLPFFELLPNEYKPFCYEGLGLSTSLFFFKMDATSSLKRERILSVVQKYFTENKSEKEYRKFFFRGIGKNVTIVFDRARKKKNWDNVFARIRTFKSKGLKHEDENECYFGAGEGIGELVGHLFKYELIDFQSIPYFCRNFFYMELNDYLYGLYKNLKQLPEPMRKNINEGINDVLKKEGINPHLKNYVLKNFIL